MLWLGASGNKYVPCLSLLQSYSILQYLASNLERAVIDRPGHSPSTPSPVQDFHVATSPELVPLPETCPSHPSILQNLREVLQYSVPLTKATKGVTPTYAHGVTSSCNPTSMKPNASTLRMYDANIYVLQVLQCNSNSIGPTWPNLKFK